MTLFLPVLSNPDHVIGLEGCHSARDWLHSGQPHLQARQRCAYARLLHGGERLSAQVGVRQCQHTQTCIHEIRVIATSEKLTQTQLRQYVLSGCGKKKEKRKEIILETGLSSLNVAAR